MPRYTEAVALDPTEGKVPANYNVKEADDFLGGSSGEGRVYQYAGVSVCWEGRM
jgi:hypothetical protein